MAYTNTPQNSTYRREEVTFDATPTLRSASSSVRRDSHIINFFYDRISQENKTREVMLKKRPGIQATAQTLQKSVTTDTVRGYFYEEQEDIYFWAVGNKVYKYIPAPAGSYTALVATLATSSGGVGFEKFQKSTGEVYILFSDGTNLWSQQLRVYPDTAAASVVDADLPASHIPSIVVVDGYVFLAKGNDLYNSDNDTFDSWTSGNFITCEMSADGIRHIFQNKNYIVAIGYDSLEVFWDAANVSGSPLSRNDSAFKSIGYITGYAKAGDKHYFVGQEKGKLQSVFMMDGFKVDKISDEVVDRTIQSQLNTDFGVAQVASSKGHIVSVDGHTFYMLCSTGITWVFDVDEKMWYEWRTSSNAQLRIEAVWAKYNGGQYIAIKDANTLDFMSPLIYQDKGSNFTCSYTTEDNLFGSSNWKVCNRTILVADRHLATGTSNLTLQWSDNDWTDNPTSSQTLNVFANRPTARRCGRFINRSYRLLYSDNYPLRMKSLELMLNIGTY